jgi:hypothetical protein
MLPKVRLTSLLLVEERLLESDYFARRLRNQRGSDRFRYELNAFLAAARSVTFLLQKEMAKVPGFSDWWNVQRTVLAGDPAMRFFLNLRNYSQKEGRVSVVGSGTASERKRRWSYRFAGNAERVPSSLLQRDISDCCREHVAKLAKVILGCATEFPYHVCPRRALTPEGIAALHIQLGDVEEALGLPRGWTDIGSPDTTEERIKYLAAHVDEVNFSAISKLARWKPRRSKHFSKTLSDGILTSLVTQLEGPRRKVNYMQLAASLMFGEQAENDGSKDD